ncbi:hypothetical protein ACQR94_28190, partial [Klebsiella pneumoniae]
HHRREGNEQRNKHQHNQAGHQQSRLICDRAALTGSPADAAPFAVGAAASVVIFPGSDRFTWPLNSAARLVVNHGRLTHRRVWQEEMAHES